ncbi:sugar phosphate nucleotidyltransferase [Roseburia hominis]
MIDCELQKFIGMSTMTVSEAMQKIDANTCGILMISDGDGKLVGCLTDGDIRRYLLSGGRLDGNVIEAANKRPKYARTFDEAISLFHKKNYIAIPVLDEEDKIVSIYLGNGEIEVPKVSLNIPVVINAGGKGTRLDPYTRVLPKPLIPVGELPVIEHIMQRFMGYDCNRFHIIVNYKKQIMKGYFAEKEGEYDISWYEEEKPLNTGGGLTLLKGTLHETFFFTNCDNLLLSNYDSIIRFHKEHKNAITMICAYKNLQIPYGVVEMGIDGVIKEMKEKPQLSFLTNTGIYVVEPEVLDDMEDGVSIGFPDVVEQQKDKGRNVAIYPVSENDWLDMGQLPELENMRKRLYGE